MRTRTSRRPAASARFTPDVFAAIPMWLVLGVTPREIAAAIGTTENSLRAMCSGLGISLSSPSLRAGEELRYRLTLDQIETLRMEASRRGLSVFQLMVELVVAVTENNLFTAVLTDHNSEDAA